jgi:uncharacterized protein (DUF1800 family)
MSLESSKTQKTWNLKDAAHLLRRTQWGATRGELEQALRDGLEATVERLLAPPTESPVFEETAALLRQTALHAGDLSQLKMWWLYRMTASASPLTERMALFWHNHFATSNVKVRAPELMAQQNDLFRTHALGDFKALLAAISRDPAMLIWLDGNANRLRSPNENFARELMELFSLGEGHYHERDIKEAARAFAGWHVRNQAFWLNTLQQDFGPKTVFSKTSALNGEDVINLCLAHEACPQFLARKLLREFVMPSPDEKAVADVAASIRRHDYSMAPVLRELFTSAVFFSVEARHSLIKSPVDFVLGAYRQLEARPNLKAAASIIAQLGQDLFQPPTVKGWEGGRLWITTATLLLRTEFASNLLFSDTYGTLSALPGSIEHAAELLLAAETDMSRLRGQHLTRTGKSPDEVREAIQMLMVMPEYQLA